MDNKNVKPFTEYNFIDSVHAVLSEKYPISSPRAFVHTYGCQGNVSDSERLRGLLYEMGYEFCERPEEADLVLFNTCAVREHAEDRVFGNIGALKPLKEKKPGLIIAVCGCMTQQESVSQKIKKSYPYVNIVFGTNKAARLPELLYRVLCGERRAFLSEESSGAIDEGLPIYRDCNFKAWLPIMYGCDNFCSYCIVPYVRGRERSREAGDIITEARELVSSGAKDITLLGQNVNSYGKNLDGGMNFSALLREINNIEGEFIIRFMTSHPKDCSKELLDTMAECGKVAGHLHLPFQSGNNKILAEMNRGYTRERYLDLIRYAKEVMPGLSITSDVIVGFPGETYGEFRDTLSLVKEAEFTSLFTFVYSKRSGTKAAGMEDIVLRSEKNKWFKELTDLQDKIAAGRNAGIKGTVCKVLVEERDAREGKLMGRTDGHISIFFDGEDSLIGTFQHVRITEALTWVLCGKVI